MTKDLIIGAYHNYNSNQLKPWVESIEDVTQGQNIEKVMVVGSSSDETRQWLIDKGWILIDLPKVNLPIHVLRFYGITDYLKDNWKKYRYVVTTDVKDIYFQSNPFKWLESNLNDKKLVAGSESLNYKDESWGDKNLKDTFGPYIHGLFKDKEIYNVGTIGGESEYVKDLVLTIFINAIGKPIAITDQAVYNVLMHTLPYKDIVYFASQSTGWACQAGTTVDPTKIAGFRPNLLEAEPIWENNIVKTGQDSYTCKKGTPFVIVHQYDRVPEWKKFVEEKYDQKDMIVIRT